MSNHHADAEVGYSLDNDHDEDDRPECGSCRRKRALGHSEHPMDTYDYNPMQVITGQPLGWYSGDDGEVCPECMEKMIRGQR